jgi:hypothetical protein
MASAAVTAASAAAALVPFEMSLGCLMAKGVYLHQNFRVSIK